MELTAQVRQVFLTASVLHIHFTDIDECEAGTDNCHPNASCTDTEGSFECMCSPEFTGDGVNCYGKIIPYNITFCNYFFIILRH